MVVKNTQNDEIKNYKDKTIILNKGYIQLLNVMGDEDFIAYNARMSYQEGTKKVNNNSGLLSYMMEHWHSSPFESCELSFEIKCPKFVAAQWMRHRTLSFNEKSLRYSDASNIDFYEPASSRIQGQSEINKQSSDGNILDEAEEIVKEIRISNNESLNAYRSLIDKGVSREIARGVLNENFMTVFTAKGNLKNWLDFVYLRIKDNAQYEIRVYAEFILDAIGQYFSTVHDAFLKFRLNSVFFADDEIVPLISICSIQLLKLQISAVLTEFSGEDINEINKINEQEKVLNEELLKRLGKRRAGEFEVKLEKMMKHVEWDTNNNIYFLG